MPVSRRATLERAPIEPPLASPKVGDIVYRVMSSNLRARSLWATPPALWTGATSGEPIAPYPSPATAVLAVDLQRDFLADDARMPIARAQVEPLLRASNAVLAAARERGWLVVTVGNEFPPGDWLRNIVRRGAAIRGTPGAAIDPRVHPVSDAYFPKDRRDAFTNPALDAWLREKQVDRIVVLGVMADACVRATVLGARNRGYRVAVVRDAVGAPNEGGRETALTQMALAGVEVVSAGDLLRGVAAPRPA